jgi:hypothetical protein
VPLVLIIVPKSEWGSELSHRRVKKLNKAHIKISLGYGGCDESVFRSNYFKFLNCHLVSETSLIMMRTL